MPTPAELRHKSRRFLEAAKKEPKVHLKRALAIQALASAQLAEMIERKQAESGGIVRKAEGILLQVAGGVGRLRRYSRSGLDLISRVRP